MAKIESAFFNLGLIDTLANQQTAVHSLDPRTKLMTTLVFIITVMSFDPYDISGVVPFFIFPFFMIRVGNLPMIYMVKRIAFILPFVILIGILNPFFDRTPLMKIGSIALSGGMISFSSILLRCILTVLAALTLIATTGFHGICMALERIGVPNMFVIQLLFVYRYLFVLVEEASRMARARALRTFSATGMDFKVWSSLIGHLLLRTIDRARRIHFAMLSRGFTGDIRLARQYSLGFRDIVFFLAWSSIFIVLRFYNLSKFVGNSLTNLMP
jgi:cobalt/nickel transport system permease protein